MNKLHWLGKILRTDTNEREINLDQFMLQTLCYNGYPDIYLGL